MEDEKPITTHTQVILDHADDDDQELDTDFSMATDENSDSPSDREGGNVTLEPIEVDEDFGPMNEADARESGYIDDDGMSVDRARPDEEGSPTGALTDVGAGRSSAVTNREIS